MFRRLTQCLPELCRELMWPERWSWNLLRSLHGFWCLISISRERLRVQDLLELFSLVHTACLQLAQAWEFRVAEAGVGFHLQGNLLPLLSNQSPDSGVIFYHVQHFPVQVNLV